MHLIKEEKIGVNLIVNIFTECYNANTFNWSHTPVYLIIHWCQIRLARIPPCCWQNNLDGNLFARFQYEISVRTGFFFILICQSQKIFLSSYYLLFYVCTQTWESIRTPETISEKRSVILILNFRVLYQPGYNNFLQDTSCLL